MPLNHIKYMLNELIQYKDTDITYFFSKYEVPFSVTLKKGKNPYRFLITFMDEQNAELLTDLETAARVIDELVENTSEDNGFAALHY
ncbi:hypothetical protein [Bacillus sp. V5-8f]|uniref:hypothetical protein n=1 Tax=Bacillus sp. V5-8f TaxID=2053044 RepID=UPI000C783E52|nr:hypothetical protein [Bacillus sp. V5-8f]PLT33136.1 hypothetical protein CUU64_15250 [Bacillus sp. V5-8f]